MVGQLNIAAMVNGKQAPMYGDPFNLASFPGAVDSSRGKTLDKLGKDITVVARMLAKSDPDIENISLNYEIKEGNLIIKSEQINRTGTDEIGRPLFGGGPNVHVFKAAMSVLHGHNYSDRNTLKDVSFDIVQTWRTRRHLAGGPKTLPMGKGQTFNTFKGVLGSPYSLMGVI